jgi:iron complex transport system substrate-binding protein
MMRRWSIVCFFALLAACGTPVANQSPAAEAPSAPAATAASAATGFPMTITDGSGTTLSFDAPPTRIACLYTRCIEVLAALRYDQIAVPTWANDFVNDLAYFPQPNTITLLPETSDDIGVDLEQLAAFKPDLILGWAELRPSVEAFAPVHAVVDDMNSYEKSFDEIRTFGKLLGREAEAEQQIKRALERLAAYKALSPNNVAVMYGFFSQGAFSYRDGASGTCNLFKEIARCDWPDPENSSSWSVEVGDEGLLAFDPDVLLVDSYGFDGKTNEQIIEELAQRPLWAELSAVKNKRLYIVSEAVANVDGMGTVGMSRMLDVYGPLLYPDVFPQALTDAQVQEILAQ